MKETIALNTKQNKRIENERYVNLILYFKTISLASNEKVGTKDSMELSSQRRIY